MKHFVISAFMIFFISLFAVSSWAEMIDIHNSDKYVIAQKDKNCVNIIDVAKHQIKEKKFDFEILKMEVCQRWPFLFFIGKKFDDRGNSIKKNYLYDIEKELLVSVGQYTDTTEKVWSSTGEFTYFNEMTSIVIIETKNLREYIRHKSKRHIFVEITGHPMGLIWQVKWIDRYLIYASGIGGGAQCWGLYDLKLKKNYFLGCCGMTSNKDFQTPCKKNSRSLNRIIKQLTHLIKSENLIAISNDFYNEVLRITSRNRRNRGQARREYE
jgi:hypothetical protein